MSNLMSPSVELLKVKQNNIQSSEVLTNLSFLDKGATWPPPTQLPRLARYARNRMKFKNKVNINKKAFDHVMRIIDNNWTVISYRLLINFYRKISFKTADLLFVERPIYSTKTGDQDTLDEIVDLSKLGSIGYQGAIDASRFGDVIYTIKVPAATDEDGEEDQGKGRMAISNPEYWFPVASEKDLKEIEFHVIAFVITRQIDAGNNKKKDQDFLQYQIHSKGSIEFGERTIEDGGELGEKTPVDKGKEIIKTELSDFAVVPSHNVVTSDSLFGIDDYEDIIPIIDELQVRFEKIAMVLDKHSDPSMSGPSSALDKDKETGEYSVKVGGYFQRDNKDDPDVEYITWDADLDSSFKEIELLLQLLADISEMGAAIFGKESEGGGEISGRALRLKYVNPLTKVARIRNNFDDTFKQGIALSSEVGYGENKMERKDISIGWQDGLPNDPKELAEIGQIRAGGSTDTVINQIMKQDGLNLEDATAKSLLIATEEAARAPGIGSNLSFLTNPEDEV